VDNWPQVIKKQEFALWQSNNIVGQSSAERFTRCNKAVRIAYNPPAKVRVFSVGVFSGIASMGAPLRLSRADGAGFGRALGCAVIVCFVVANVATPASGQTSNSVSATAQRVPPPPPPQPAPPAPPPSPPPPVPHVTDISSDVSAGAAITDLGSNFLRRLGNQATYGFSKALGANPNGGGASESSDGPRFRTWGEAYGASVRTGPIGDFVGDKRTTYGGVAGFGARLAPGVNVGVSIDQSHTRIDVPLAFQSATLDLTQLGLNASIDKGPWTWAMALVHGFGNVGSNRNTGAGTATAGYNARIDGVLTELDYYWSLDQSRIVPKAAFEYVRASTGSFQEIGGP
jgi:hypothetical protein